MNLSRVIGPAIGAVIYSQFSAAPVFAINAGTYLFAVAGVVLARYRQYAPGEVEETGLARLLSGFRLAARDPLIRRILTTLVLFSLFSLTFVGLMPAIAADNFGIRPRSIQYGLLYAVFGFGAALGAISVGTLSQGGRRRRSRGSAWSSSPGFSPRSRCCERMHRRTRSGSSWGSSTSS